MEVMARGRPPRGFLWKQTSPVVTWLACRPVLAWSACNGETKRRGRLSTCSATITTLSSATTAAPMRDTRLSGATALQAVAAAHRHSQAAPDFGHRQRPRGLSAALARGDQPVADGGNQRRQPTWRSAITATSSFLITWKRKRRSKKGAVPPSARRAAASGRAIKISSAAPAASAWANCSIRTICANGSGTSCRARTASLRLCGPGRKSRASSTPTQLCDEYLKYAGLLRPHITDTDQAAARRP